MVFRRKDLCDAMLLYEWEKILYQICTYYSDRGVGCKTDYDLPHSGKVRFAPIRPFGFGGVAGGGGWMCVWWCVCVCPKNIWISLVDYLVFLVSTPPLLPIGQLNFLRRTLGFRFGAYQHPPPPPEMELLTEDLETSSNNTTPSRNWNFSWSTLCRGVVCGDKSL